MLSVNGPTLSMLKGSLTTSHKRHTKENTMNITASKNMHMHIAYVDKKWNTQKRNTLERLKDGAHRLSLTTLPTSNKRENTIYKMTVDPK